MVVSRIVYATTMATCIARHQNTVIGKINTLQLRHARTISLKVFNVDVFPKRLKQRRRIPQSEIPLKHPTKRQPIQKSSKQSLFLTHTQMLPNSLKLHQNPYARSRKHSDQLLLANATAVNHLCGHPKTVQRIVCALIKAYTVHHQKYSENNTPHRASSGHSWDPQSESQVAGPIQG